MKKQNNLHKAIDALKNQPIPAGPSRDVMDATIAKLSESAASPDVKPDAGRILTAERINIMKRFAKIAIAASIVVAALVTIRHFAGSVDGASVAWAEVVQKVEQAEAFTYRIKIKMMGMPNYPKEKVVDAETYAYISPEYGMRMDSFVGGKLESRTYVVPAQKAIFSVMPAMKKYMRLELTDEMFEKMRKQNCDPRATITQIMKYDYTELGRKTIDGIEVAGIESTDPRVAEGTLDNVIVRLWVDVKTDLPVLMEMKFSSSDGATQIEMATDDFKWHVDLTAGDFEPDIPADYTVLAEMKLPEKNEAALVQGLRLFAELSGGKYPSSLSLMTVMSEASKIMGEKSGRDPNRQPSKDELERMMSIQIACMFYADLVQKNQDPAYYGDRVAASDVDAVLLRWKISENEYRVIFGDFTTKNISAEKLSELETPSQK